MNDWTRGELLSLAEVLVGAVALLVALVAIVMSLWGWTLRAWLTERRLVTRFGADLYLAEDIRNATRYYVRPDATSIDLAQEIEEGNNVITTRENLFQVVDRFLAEESPHRHMLLFADSGMGKSSFVLNYYDYNRRKWFKRHKVAVIPLGYENALEKIKEIKKQNEYILFLDAFDEDPSARQDYEGRLYEIMKSCAEFRRVLITCRTQFFPNNTAIPNVASMILAPRAGKSQHTFWRLYLAPFSDKQVNKYLRRRFWFWEFRKKYKARELTTKVPKLTVRPMLLLNIPDLIETEKPLRTTWDIYAVMIEKWYEREIGFWKEKEALRKFSEELAVQFYLNFLQEGADRVSSETITRIFEQNEHSSIDIHNPIAEIDKWKATARSLLHRDAEGNWKFAHRSIMEFLFLKKFFEGDDRCRNVAWTDQMKKFVLERTAPDGYPLFLSLGSLSGADLSRANLYRANLFGAQLFGVDLSGADLSEANLGHADLREAILRGVDFREADLRLANLENADIRADLRGARLFGANLSNADLSHADLRYADLTGANLRNAVLFETNLEKADLSGTDFSGADLRAARRSSLSETV